MKLVMPIKLKKNEAKRGQHLTFSAYAINLAMKAASMTGLDPEKIYKEIDFDSNLLKDPKARISFKQGNYIWNEVIKRSPDQDIGLHVGENIDFTAHILPSIVFNSPTVGDALRNYCRYCNIVHDAVIPELCIQEDSAILTLRLQASDIINYRHFVEIHLSNYYFIISGLTQGKLKLDMVHFVHPSPSNITEHKRIFKTSILFDQLENKLIFNKKYLDFPVFMSNPDLLETLEGHAKKLQRAIYRADTFPARVESAIMKIFPSGKSDINTISKQFDMNKRSLQNKLKQEGTTYLALLNKVRKKQAKYFLEQTDIPIIEIAFLLDYSEQSAFNRAFKKWTGITPGDYRLKSEAAKNK